VERAYTHHRDFKAFHPEQAKAFKAHLTSRVSLRSGGRRKSNVL
jgi:hypothetical protein